MNGRIAVVTGGASGIGLACVRTLLHSGARVGVHDLELTEELDGLMRNHSDRACFAAGDVSNESDVQAAHCEIVERLGHPDGLVCAAGVMSGKTLRDTSIQLWKRTFAVNVEGTVLWMQSVLEDMVAKKRGAIVTFSSQLTRCGGRNNAAYIAAKGAITALTRTAALEHAEDRIRINAVVPGAIDTPMLRNGALRFPDPEAALQRSMTRHPLGRFGTPEELASCVAFLLSDGAGFMTGSELVADGGWSIG
ncbi:MAG: SDR family oxidoreductase [Burkholderiaceae bacterium]|nr:SDR family oxidoreductase [Burkholderiaceae bacterium]